MCAAVDASDPIPDRLPAGSSKGADVRFVIAVIVAGSIDIGQNAESYDRHYGPVAQEPPKIELPRA